MTRDLEIRHPCPHRVRGEWVAIDPDLQTIRPLEIPSSSDVVLKRNGFEVPRAGVFSPARTRSTRPGPFEIIRGQNDEFKFSLSEGATVTVTLPPGPSVRLETIARVLRAETSGIRVDLDENGLLVRTDNAGPSAHLMLEGGSAHETLGFPSRRHYNGRQVFPGWSLVKRTGSVIPQDRVIVFDRPVDSDDNIYEVNYTTRQQDCRRCQGIGVENDFRYDANGEPITVDNEALLLQEVQKITFTIKGSNVFERWYGTSLIDMIGSKVSPVGNVVESQMAAEISNALEAWRNQKEQQSAVQDVTQRELLANVPELRVVQDDDDPSTFDVFVTVQNAAGEQRRFSSTVLTQNRQDEFEFIA